MTAWPAHPVVHEVNTVVWLREQGARHGGPLTLATVPAEGWDELALPGVDAVWLMGVWERSPVGLAIARADQALMASFREALPVCRDEDVVGSPYCVRRYVADEALGGPAALAVARQELARRGVRLVLDYVPNHVAPDHPWVQERPDVFVRGSAEDLAGSPEAFLDAGGHVLARGRDPYFPPWPDVVQLNAFSEAMRAATVETLVDIGEQCDGVRCDMAMLLVNEVFARTWGERAGAVPDAELWPSVLARVRERHPDMLFVAEAYWDLEGLLQHQGFDHCYDKRLYDRMLGDDAGAVRAHLAADPGYQRHLVRFLENHDEPRAAATLGPPPREQVSAVAVATLPGLTLWHEGQLDGRRVRLPVFLARRPDEPADAELRDFHLALLDAARHSGMRTGDWQLLECTGWPSDGSCRHLVAWAWDGGTGRHLTVVNLSDQEARGRVHLPWADVRGRQAVLTGLLSGEVYERDGHELADAGLFVALPPWGHHVLRVEVPGAEG
jgi:hypothetical protein